MRHAFILSDHPCECGCGQLTNLAPFTWKTKGWAKGKPIRFVKGHYRRDLMKRRTLAEAFVLHAIPGPAGECWEWRGPRDLYGYGVIGHGGKTLKAHRVSWELANGPIPEGQAVCHRCDNPPCWNPSHLFSGTQQDNLRDMNQKRRGNQGERNPQAKLTAERAAEIRALKGQEHPRAIASRYGVSATAVRDILAGRTWRATA